MCVKEDETLDTLESCSDKICGLITANRSTGNISRVRIRHSINSMNLRSPACAIYHRLNMTIHMKDAYALSKCVACRQFRMHASELSAPPSVCFYTEGCHRLRDTK
jgi:hypothetical protein